MTAREGGREGGREAWVVTGRKGSRGEMEGDVWRRVYSYQGWREEGRGGRDKAYR